MDKKTLVIYIVFIAVVVSAIGGASYLLRDTPDNNKKEIVDMLGRTVSMPEKVERVVGVEAGALRLIVYLNASELVVGIEDTELDAMNPYNLAHPELVNLPVIGPMHGGDAELITAQQPDVIFWTYTTVDDADELAG